jgi:hypothetical protein
MRRLLPTASLRGISAAFLGGVHLERLYARERMCYRALFARPSPCPAPQPPST